MYANGGIVSFMYKEACMLMVSMITMIMTIYSLHVQRDMYDDVVIKIHGIYLETSSLDLFIIFTDSIIMDNL